MESHQTGELHINNQQALGLAGLLQGGFTCGGEGLVLAKGDDNDMLAGILGDIRGIVMDHAIERTLLVKHHPGEDDGGRQAHDRVQPHAFGNRREKQGKLQRRTGLGGNDIPQRPDRLSPLLMRGSIQEPVTGKQGIDSRHRIGGLPYRSYHLLHKGVMGLDEHGKDFGIPVPPGGGMHGYRAAPSGEGMPLIIDQRHHERQ